MHIKINSMCFHPPAHTHAKFITKAANAEVTS